MCGLLHRVYNWGRRQTKRVKSEESVAWCQGIWKPSRWSNELPYAMVSWRDIAEMAVITLFCAAGALPSTSAYETNRFRSFSLTDSIHENLVQTIEKVVELQLCVVMVRWCHRLQCSRNSWIAWPNTFPIGSGQRDYSEDRCASGTVGRLLREIRMKTSIFHFHASIWVDIVVKRNENE